MIKLIRSDDRLIHGQCVTQIVKLYAIQHILVIDDFTATNPFLKRIFEKAVPSNITAEALTFDQAISDAAPAGSCGRSSERSEHCITSSRSGSDRRNKICLSDAAGNQRRQTDE